MPGFFSSKEERLMHLLNDFERYIYAIDINPSEFNFVIFALLDGVAKWWCDPASSAP